MAIETTDEQFEEYLQSLHHLTESEREERRQQHKAMQRWARERSLVDVQERAQNEVSRAIDELARGLGRVAQNIYRGDQGLSAMTDMTDAMGKAASGVGKAMILLGGRFTRLAGVALQLAGPISGYVKRAAAQADRQFESYQKLSQSGAVFSGNMQELVQDSKRMGYLFTELDRFESLIARNSKSLAQFGGTALEGRRELARVGQDLYARNSDLLQLGVGFDEANEYAADYISILGQRGVNSVKTSQELTDSVREYVLQQNIVNQLTGMSREDALRNRQESAKSQIFLGRKIELEKQGRGDLADKLDMVFDLLSEQGGADIAKGFADSVGMFGAITEDANRLRMTGNDDLVASLNKFADPAVSAADIAQGILDNSGKFWNSTGRGMALLNINNKTFISAQSQVRAQTSSMQQINKKYMALRERQARILRGDGDSNTKSYAQLLNSQREMSRAFQNFTDIVDSTFEPILTGFTEALAWTTRKAAQIVSFISNSPKLKLLSNYPVLASVMGLWLAYEQDLTGSVPGAPSKTPDTGKTPKPEAKVPAAPAGAPATKTPPTGAAPATKTPLTAPAAAPKTQPRPEPATGSPPNVSLGGKANLNNVNSGLLTKFYTFARDWNQPLTITSAYRTDQEQAELWVRANYLREPGIYSPTLPQDATTVTLQNRTYQVPGSGRSNSHTEGRALDISGAGVSAGMSSIDSALNQAGLSRPHLNLGDYVHVQAMAQGGITRGLSIAGEAGPEAVIPLTHGPISLEIPNLEQAVENMKSSDQDTPLDSDLFSNDLTNTVNQAVDAYRQSNAVELEILDILRSIGYTSGAVAANQSRIYSAQVN